MYSLLLLTVLAEPETRPAPASGAQPMQVQARIDKENLTITMIRTIDQGGGCYGSAPLPREGDAPPRKDTEKVPVKLKVTTLMMVTAELPARSVQAHTVEGKAISAETLTNLLTRERTVL